MSNKRFISKFRSSTVRTKPVSVRLDDDILSYFRESGLNLSSTINHLLRSYLYIQNVDDSIVFDRLNASVPAPVSIHVDVYTDLSVEL